MTHYTRPLYSVPTGCSMTDEEFEMRATALRKQLMDHYNSEWRRALLCGVVLGATFVAALWIV